MSTTPDLSALLDALVKAAGRRDVLHTLHIGKAMSDETYATFAKLRDETIPELRRQIAALSTHTAQAAVTGRTKPRNDDEQAAAQFFADNPSAALVAFDLYLHRGLPAAHTAQAAEVAKPDGKLHDDGYFTWNTSKHEPWTRPAPLPCDFWLTPQPATHTAQPLTDERAAFEAFFEWKNQGRGPSKRPTFARLADGTYADDHTQRHWWTWQHAIRAHGIGTPAQQAGSDAGGNRRA